MTSNEERLRLVAGALGPLLDEVVFVGGAAVGLLIDDPAAPPVRVTLDVDCVVEADSRSEYFGRVREALLSRDFVELRAEGAPICAWSHGGVRLDVMPTNSRILGFTNRWYSSVLQNYERYDLGNISIKLITSPLFLATKLEAFESRGGNDYMASPDLEDIVAVVDGRIQIVEEVGGTTASLRSYLSGKIAGLLASPRFLDALPGHVLEPGRESAVLGRLRAIAAAT